MPYSFPAQGRAGHRRSFSNIVPPPSLASTSTTGAFAPLGALPTRRRPSRPTFQLGKEDDDDSQDESPTDVRPTKLTINTNLNDDDEHGHLPPLRLKSKFVSSFDDQASPGAVSVPFPRSSPLPSPTLQDRPHPPESRTFCPSVSRTASTPILLANGKPLKSSLKSSSSSPNIPFPPQSLVPSIMFPQLHQQLPTHHQRACSAPATPNLDPLSPNPSASPSPNPQSPASSPSLQKNVHFPSQEEGGLTTVRVYKRSAKPASLLRKGDETETETEGESSSAPNGFNLPSVWGSRWNQTSSARTPGYPFPKFGSPIPKKPSPLADHDDSVERLEIDMGNSSPIPARGVEQTSGNVHFETLGFIGEPDKLAKPLTLTGTVLVRNISYHKTVAVRYTLDDWNTTNDVLARHEQSLAALPERFLLASLPLIEEGGGCPEGERRREVVCRPYGFEDALVEGGGTPKWDRFRFDISLETYESSIQQRTMWFVGRYTTAPVDGVGSVVPGGEKEWWDNNFGNNYRVSFVKKAVEVRVEEEAQREGAANSGAGYRRNVVFSAPPVFSPSKPFPAPPQISASLSYPVGMTSARREHAAASHAALTQRLKKFGFANYAAPSPVGASPLPSTCRDEHDELPSSETSTANTSTDSTPLQTPRQDDKDGSRFHFGGKPHDVNANVLVHDDEPGRDGLAWGLSGNLQMQDGHPATFIPPVPSLSVTDEQDVKHMIQDPTPTATEPRALATNPMEIKDRGLARVEREPSTLEVTPAHTISPPPSTLSLPDGFGVEMGTSPPFSLLSGMELRNGMFASKESSGLHWPWGGGSKQESTETTPTLPNIVAPTPQHVTTSNAHTRTSSPNQGLSGSLMPPQRKKSHHHSHSLPNKPPTFSIGRTSSSSSRSGSGSSGSGSDTPNGALTSPKKGSINIPNLVSPQPWPLPANQLRRVMSPPPTFGSRRIFEIKADDDEAFSVDQPPQCPSPPSLNPSLSEMQIPTSPANDAVYQAFVRQWCFAQGPPPNLGAGPPRKSERISPLSPDVVVR